MAAYALGLDYGTNSCRALLVDLDAGAPVAEAVFDYPSGDLGVLTDPRDPHTARQHPQDYLDGLSATVREALAQAGAKVGGFAPDQVVGIGVDTTGSTPLPVDDRCQPLALRPELAQHLDAMAWLWKDHSSHAEAEEITELAKRLRPELLASCGGVYSSEWFWSKALRFARVAPDLFAQTHSWVELCDWIPGVLVGVERPEELRRSVCAAGHKALFDATRGGLPDGAFLAELDPRLEQLRARLYERAATSDQRAGGLCAAWAEQLGLPEGTPVAVGAFDAHMGAVGAGAREGRLVKILGTSTCDIMVTPAGAARPDIRGVCGVVDGSVLPGRWGIEAGQSAVGDIFLWCAGQHTDLGGDLAATFAAFEREAAALAPGEHGLLALDWHNGNRTVLVDPLLSGLVVGETLATTPAQRYRAYLEATAFGALKIIERIEQHGVPVEEVVCCGGLAVKNPLLLQIYADVTGRPMLVSAVDQTCALGAALFGAAAAGHADLVVLQERCSKLRAQVVRPDPQRHAVYRELYGLYTALHDAFGPEDGALGSVMKRLIALREGARR